MKQVWIDQLWKMMPAVAQGIIVGVRVRKPMPWPPALQMIEMHARGDKVETIAAATGYSIITVKRNLALQGMDHRTGPQCDRHAGRAFSVQEALDEMPLPCSASCVCDWSPILRADLDPPTRRDTR